MQHFLISFKKLSLCIGLLFCSLQLISEKRGLIIAIGDYPIESGWPQLSSANDIKHIQSAFGSLGFDSSNIDVIKDMDATKVNIINALESLISKSQSGDYIFIHYSGHGQQVVDNNGDELDGLDEAIVPIDSPMKYNEKNNRGEKLITDDDLQILTQKLRKKIGNQGQLILILDSCHSGTGTRGSGIARGTDNIMAPENFKVKSTIKEKTIGFDLDNASLAPMACYFGAGAKELNYETLDDQFQPVGSLSYSFASIIGKLSSSISFSELFERVKIKMKALAPDQNPQWEGPTDVYLLGDNFTPQQILFQVEKVKNNYATINVGSLSEVYEGSKVELFSVDKLQVVGNGEIINVGLTTSEVKLMHPISAGQEELIKAKIIERTIAPIKSRLNINHENIGPWSELIDNILSEQHIVESNTNADLYITSENDVLTLKDKFGNLIFQKPFRDSRLDRYTFQIKKVLTNYMQGAYIRKFDSNNNNFKIELKLVEVDCQNNDTVIRVVDNQEVQIGDCIKLQVKNTGTQAAYFSVLDIQPDNVINLIIPAMNLGYTAAEYYLEPGQEFTTHYPIEIAEPAGNEQLKLIATNEPLDLSSIMSTRGSLTRGEEHAHPFEKILAATYLNDTRGGKLTQPSIKELGTTNQHFLIKK